MLCQIDATLESLEHAYALASSPEEEDDEYEEDMEEDQLTMHMREGTYYLRPGRYSRYLLLRNVRVLDDIR